MTSNYAFERSARQRGCRVPAALRCFAECWPAAARAARLAAYPARLLKALTFHHARPQITADQCQPPHLAHPSGHAGRQDVVLASSSSHRHPGQISPRKTCAVCAPPPHLPCASYPRASSSGADSPRALGLLCRFCPSAHTFALRLPSDNTSRPCLRLVGIVAACDESVTFPRVVSPHKLMPMSSSHFSSSGRESA